MGAGSPRTGWRRRVRRRGTPRPKTIGWAASSLRSDRSTPSPRCHRPGDRGRPQDARPDRRPCPASDRAQRDQRPERAARGRREDRHSRVGQRQGQRATSRGCRGRPGASPRLRSPRRRPPAAGSPAPRGRGTVAGNRSSRCPTSRSRSIWLGRMSSGGDARRSSARTPRIGSPGRGRRAASHDGDRAETGHEQEREQAHPVTGAGRCDPRLDREGVRLPPTPAPSGARSNPPARPRRASPAPRRRAATTTSVPVVTSCSSWSGVLAEAGPDQQGAIEQHNEPILTRSTSAPVTVADRARAATAKPAALDSVDPSAGAPRPCAAKPTTKAAARHERLCRPADARAAGRRRSARRSGPVARGDPQQVGREDRPDEPRRQAERRRQRVGQHRRADEDHGQPEDRHTRSARAATATTVPATTTSATAARIGFTPPGPGRRHGAAGARLG